MAFTIERKAFDPHPTGRHTGTIVKVQDEGMRENTWEGQITTQHKLSIRIDSDSALMENGDPFSIIAWFTVSSSPMGNLRKFREAVLDRTLTREEETTFDPDVELIGRKISYRIDHKEKMDGSLRAVIREGSVEPVHGAGRDSNNDEGASGRERPPTSSDLAF